MKVDADWHSHGEPLERLLAFHRRIERRLAHLAALPGHLAAHGAGAESCATAAAILHCFGQMERHHAREERVLLPMVERRIGESAARTRFREMRRRLAAEHRQLEDAWRALRPPLDAIAEGMVRRLSPRAIHDFRAGCARHIAFEEAAVLGCHEFVTELKCG